MTDIKTDVKLDTGNMVVSTILGYLPVQCTLFVLHYGNIVTLPTWVAWFPTILYGSIFGVAILLVLLGALLGIAKSLL